jgi:hypothetical protein
MNSQVIVQSDIDLHKPKKKVDGVSWNLTDAHMNHELDKLTRHTMAQTWRKATTSFHVTYFMTCSGGCIKVIKKLPSFKFQRNPKNSQFYSRYESHNFVGS